MFQVMTPIPTAEHPDIADKDKIKKINDLVQKERNALDTKAKITFLSNVLKNQVDINEIFSTGETGLFIAVKNENMELCRFLIAHGANALLGRNNCNENILHLLSKKCSGFFDVNEILTLIMRHVSIVILFAIVREKKENC